METPDIRTRIGRFKVNDAFLFSPESRQVVAMIMKDVIVLETNRSRATGEVEFFACSEKFDQIRDDTVIPLYVAELSTVRYGDEEDDRGEVLELNWRVS